MRSPEELVQELDREAKQFSMVAIVVAFDDTSRYVFHDDNHEKLVADLRSMIAEGGEPFGLLGYVANEKTASVASFVYDEFQDSIWAKPLMEELAQGIADTLKGYQDRGARGSA